MLGTIGQLLLLLAFVACALSGIAFFKSTRQQMASDWRTLGRASWGVMVAAVLGASAILSYLIFTHQYQYALVYQHSSNDLPWYFLLSSLWAGQEGSFLLWIIFTGFIGGGIIRWTREYETPVMTVIAFSQLFLLSMVAGIHLGFLEIGSSPFKSLASQFPDAPIFQANPGFVPPDGTGLNELLQNYWMVIHPPTLFVGFSTMIVPFAFAIAALWQKKYTAWVKPAMPWTLFSAMVLGVGVAMGGYWAYETLSFGGYWAWDPVENSSLVPWLVSIAAIHAMLIQKKSGRGHKAALVLNILAYLLVVYSTFLTRSGILGDISVHSFVDLGLYNQLLIWIVTIGATGFGLLAYRYRDLPTPRREANVLSREFMIFTGAMLLCAVAAVITVGTSAPIFGRIFRESPSGVPISFYNKWTLPLSIGLVFLAGLGQLFWWNKMSVERINQVLLKPIALSVASTVGVLAFTPFLERTIRPGAVQQQAPPMAEAGLLGGLDSFWAVYGQSLLLLLLTFVAFFALYGNGLVLWRIGRGNPRMAGGALTHVGFALVILGIIASSGFNNPLAPPQPPGEEARNNFVLTSGETRYVEGYRVRYAGQERTEEGHTAYILDVKDPRGRSFRLKPVAFQSEQGQWFQHPDIKLHPEKDLYAAVSPRAMYESAEEDQKKPGGEIKLARGDSTVIGNREFAISFKGFDPQVDSNVVPDSAEIAVAARLNVTNLETGETRQLRPVYVVMQDRSVQYVQNRVRDWGLTISFTGMNVDNGKASLTIEGVEIAPEDWIVVQAYEKPFISVLWIGIIILVAGFLLSLARRMKDVHFTRRRSPA